MPEAIRMVIWDLDETFWHGTLTEGGVTIRPEVSKIVIELARRGIISTICSKNYQSAVQPILEREGLWDYFILPSINWDPKAPRIVRLVEDVQLRPASVLFIDDNPANLNEALHYLPDLQVEAETFVIGMLEDPRLKGKNDEWLTRLDQYKRLEARKRDQENSGTDVVEFLRSSDISVEIDYDLDSNIDRAVEMINRTNQLNFTKVRLSENLDDARRELRDLISKFHVHAGLLRVQDRYGDHGFAGLYVTANGGKELIHFCFSCRILGMGIETWMYNQLHRPRLLVVGDVLSDVIQDRREIDWVRLKLSSETESHAPIQMLADTIIARGGCDLMAAAHYLAPYSLRIVGEYNTNRGGADIRIDHSMLLRIAADGNLEDALGVYSLLGFERQDLETSLFEPTKGSSVWLLSFWQESEMSLYRHKKSGLLVPFSLPGIGPRRDATRLSVEDLTAKHRYDWVQTVLDRLRSEFVHVGIIGESLFKENLRKVLDRRSSDTAVFIVGQNEYIVDPDGSKKRHFLEPASVNSWIRDVSRDYNNVTLLPIRDFVKAESEVQNWRHFDRMVYFRLFCGIRDAMNKHLRH